MRLHLGCGRNPIPGWVNLDIAAGDGVDVVADLDACATVPLPFDDGSVDEVVGVHVLEHLRRPLPLMAELWRVARPGGTATFEVPYGSSDDAWEDPTHVRPWFAGSWLAYAQPYHWRADYGYRADWQPETLLVDMPAERYSETAPAQMFDDLMRRRNVARRMTCTLAAVKPARPADRDLLKHPLLTFRLVEA